MHPEAARLRASLRARLHRGGLRGSAIRAALPCPLDACFVNLVAGARPPARRARRPGDRRRAAPGRVDPAGPGADQRGPLSRRDRGRLSSVGSTARPLKRRLAPDLRRRVAFSRRLVGLRDGEQLAVEAALRTDVSHLRYAVRTSARLILADSPRATRQSALVKHRALLQGEISENNGSNCTQDERHLHRRARSGVLEMRRDAVAAGGRPVPLYVNLVTVLGPKVLKARPRRPGDPPGRRDHRDPLPAAPARMTVRLGHRGRRRRDRPAAGRLQHRVRRPDPGAAGARRAPRSDARERRGDRRARWRRARRAGAAALSPVVLERRARRLPRGALRRPAEARPGPRPGAARDGDRRSLASAAPRAWTSNTSEDDRAARALYESAGFTDREGRRTGR